MDPRRSGAPETHRVLFWIGSPVFILSFIPSFFYSSQAALAAVASVTHPDRVVPASRGHGLDAGGARPAHALTARPAVVLGHGRGEGLGALVALGDVVVRHPVVGPSHVLHEA